MLLIATVVLVTIAISLICLTFQWGLYSEVSAVIPIMLVWVIAGFTMAILHFIHQIGVKQWLVG